MRWLTSLVLMIGLMLSLCGCNEVNVEGRWVCDSDPSYYFELYENSVCYMFNEAGEWVSEGTYDAGKNYIAFDMDTGFFIWSRNDDTMIFESGESVKVYHQAEE